VLPGGQADEIYYHQFSLSVGYASEGVGFAPSPTIAYSYLGKSANVTLPSLLGSTGPSSYWADAEKGWTVANPIPTSTQGERWYSSNMTSGTLTAETSLKLTYQEQYNLELTASPSEGGTISPAGGWFAAGSTVELRATPAQGWQFAGWAGSAVATPTNQTSESVNLIAPAQVVAKFVAATTATTSESTGGGGIPEFPGQLFAAGAVALILVVLYSVLRRRPGGTTNVFPLRIFAAPGPLRHPQVHRRVHGHE